MGKVAEAIDLYGHYSVERWQPIENIIKPVNDSMGISYFSYTKLVDNSQRIILCNKPQFLLDYYANKIHTSKRIDLTQAPYGLSKYIWYLDPDDCPHNIIANSHDIYYRVSYVLKQKHFYEIYSYGCDRTADMNQLAYLTNRQMIWKFVYYFREQANKLIYDANNIDLKIYNELDFHISVPDSDTSITNNKIKRFYLGDDYPGQYLTQRECEVLKWLAIGKTAEETAIILSASKRTIESHITNIKAKLNCNTLFQLGEAVSRLALLDASNYE